MKRWILLLILLWASTSLAQDSPFGVQVHETAASEGYVFFAPIRGHSAFLMDKEGHLIKEWRSDYEILMAMLLENGQVLIATDLTLPLGAWRYLEAYDWDGNLLWSFEYPDMHHAFRPMPNGHILIPSWDRFTEAEILAMGLDPLLMTQPDVTTNNEDYAGMLLDKIIELDPSTMTVVWEWRSQDHLVQDYDESLPNYGVVAAAPERINLNMANLRLPSDRPHFNALDYNPELDQILISAHYFSEVWIIDHNLTTEEAAGDAGGLIYRWGNPSAYNRGTEDSRRLYFQHDAQWLPNGNILIFNNGALILHPRTALTEFSPAVQTDGSYLLGFDTAYEPIDPVWEYQANPPESFYTINLGSVQRLENGHHFVNDGASGRMFELDEAGNMVWEYLNPIFVAGTSRAFIFVARHLSPDSPALATRELIAGEQIPATILFP